jgi:hypothetical protein
MKAVGLLAACICAAAFTKKESCVQMIKIIGGVIAAIVFIVGISVLFGSFYTID